MTVTAEATLAGSRASSRRAFGALMQRDVAVLGKDKWMFIGRTVMQPLLLIFVFTYVFPKIGQGIGGSGRAAEGFSTLLVGGVIASASTVAGAVQVNLKGSSRGMLPRILTAAEAAGIDVEDLSVAEPTLETVFINLTGKELRD